MWNEARRNSIGLRMAGEGWSEMEQDGTGREGTVGKGRG